MSDTLTAMGPEDGVAGQAYEVVGVALDNEVKKLGLGGGEVLLLRSVDGEEETLIAGSAVAAGIEGGATELALAAWQEHRFRNWKRASFAEKLLDYFNDLTSCQTSGAVCDVVKRHARQGVGGAEAVIVFGDDGGTGSPGSANGDHSRNRPELPGLMLGADLDRLGSPWADALREQVESCESALIAHVPFGENGVLFLCERRAERVFDTYDWRLLTTLADQGSRAVERIGTLDTANKLSLTDPLTGLANRRHMDVVMRHAWAAAERGSELAVLLIDLDGFKQLNDLHGHSVADQILGIVGDTLRREVRGADLAVRYGGDEFLVILPAGTAAGARALARRVHQHLAGWVDFCVGVASYHPTLTDPAELLQIADRELYKAKRARGGCIPDEPPVPAERPTAAPE